MTSLKLLLTLKNQRESFDRGNFAGDPPVGLQVTWTYRDPSPMQQCCSAFASNYVKLLTFKNQRFALDSWHCMCVVLGANEDT